MTSFALRYIKTHDLGNKERNSTCKMENCILNDSDVETYLAVIGGSQMNFTFSQLIG